MRLFVGIEIPDDITAGLYPLARGIKGLDAQTPHNMHVTLKFIGEVPPVLAHEIDRALSAVDFAPFDLQICGLGMFASARKLRIFWAGVRPQPELDALARRVENTLLAMEGGPELELRHFKPHITLARNRDADRRRIEQMIADHADLTSRIFTVDRFCLYQSHAGMDGPDFRVVAAYDGVDGKIKS
ncbi:RNA 2',3'-cyclic phosphodiesterase [Thalassospira sp.]|uniref:RNA 2',3'-cyclic phosphodiesterase n=1 Tax=Thalassospira sp. TaxID=1912094 RepID=UPI0027364DD9|nr:RNA 2',3'-cyclic phosphodiesterase [Thalassospira sp.]MDP2699006.1 RNA 2',3'-cyclic phosphodiesterase [Thalassospira sp.]